LFFSLCDAACALLCAINDDVHRSAEGKD
jgi:hypothetical protein